MDKKIPIRTCIACKQAKPKKELIRIVKYEENIFLDLTGKANGRGAYVCKNSDCICKLSKQKILNRVFSCQIDDSVYKRIEEEFFGKEK